MNFSEAKHWFLEHGLRDTAASFAANYVTRDGRFCTEEECERRLAQTKRYKPPRPDIKGFLTTPEEDFT